jgi:hypothetical protein
MEAGGRNAIDEDAEQLARLGAAGALGDVRGGASISAVRV